MLAVGLGIEVQNGVLDAVGAANGNHCGEVVGSGVDHCAVDALAGDGAADDCALDGVLLVNAALIDHNSGTIGLDAALIKAGGLLGQTLGYDEFRVVGVFLPRHIGNFHAVYQNGNQLALRSCKGFHVGFSFMFRFGKPFWFLTAL